MNVFLMLLTTVSAAQAPAPAPAAAAPPVVAAPLAVHPAPAAHAPAHGGCWQGDCGSCCDTCCAPVCCEKKKRCRRKKDDCCCECCAPTCCDCCAPVCCEKEKKCRRKKKCDCCCEVPCCDTCHSCGAPDHHGAPGPIPGAVIPGAIQPGKAAEPIKKMPKDEGTNKKDEGTNKGAMLSPLSSVTPTSVKIETEAKNPFELDRRYEKRVARAADYSKLTGQLFFVHADGGLWVLRYAPLSEEDAHGGSVVLARDRMMNSYREGDLVSVQGQVISEKGSARLGGALYRVHSISLVDRPAQ